jgi:hypothetical protein
MSPLRFEEETRGVSGRLDRSALDSMPAVYIGDDATALYPFFPVADAAAEKRDILKLSTCFDRGIPAQEYRSIDSPLQVTFW